MAFIFYIYFIAIFSILKKKKKILSLNFTEFYLLPVKVKF